jgi:hypothetical protein
MSTQDLGQYVSAVRQNGVRLNANEPLVVAGPSTFSGAVNISGVTTISGGYVIGGVAAGGVTQTPASTGTVALTVTATVLTVTPTGNVTYNFSSPGIAGLEIWFVITTSGASSYNVTFGTNSKNQGVLATGTASGKVFVVNFVSDGVNWNEVARTTAM